MGILPVARPPMYDAITPMPWDSTADDWERLGRLDPYWAVVSEELYRREHMTDAQLARFLQTGEAYVEHLWHQCRDVFGTFAPSRALDFGCGVGRVTLPLARRTKSVVGVDIAQSMLDHARELLDRHGVTNVELVKGDDTLALVNGPFDLVHSVIVFQHIPVAHGLALVRRLIALAGDRGVVVLHVLYDSPFRRAWPRRVAARVLRPLFRRRSPEIQMNPYPLNTVFALLQEAGVRTLRVDLTDHAGHLGATFLFRKDERKES